MILNWAPSERYFGAKIHLCKNFNGVRIIEMRGVSCRLMYRLNFRGKIQDFSTLKQAKEATEKKTKC